MLEPVAVRASRVKFLDGGTFDFKDDGERALVFIEDHDLIAWQPARNLLASWRGVAFALGEDAIWNPATHFAGGALRVHRTTIEWLRADRDGICIVQPRLAYSQLAHVERLQFADAAHASSVKRWLQPPKPRAEFLVEICERAAA